MKLTVNQILHQGVFEHKKGNLQEAKRLYQSILEVQPKNPDANHNLGIILVSWNKSLDALPLFKIAIEANSQIEHFWINYINALITEKKFEEAEANSRKAITLNPECVAIHNNLSVILYNMGKLKEAEVSSRKAIILKPDFFEAYNNLGNVLNDLNRLDEAEESYKKSIELKPDYAEAHYNLGNTLKRLTRLNEAEVRYKKAIELKPDYAEAYFNLGSLLSKFKKSEEVITNYKKAIQLKPDYVEAYNNLGNTLNDLGKLDEAEESYKKAIELKPKYAEAYNNLGTTLNDLGKLDEAEESYNKAIKINSNYTDAYSNLETVLKQKKLLLNINQANNKIKKNESNYNNINNQEFNTRLASNLFISNRSVEEKLISSLYKMNSIELDKTKDIRYGNGRCSDYQLFENDSNIIKTVEKDLINIMSQAVKSDIFVMESFFNILRAGSGLTSHRHLTGFDKTCGLINQKYSLTYYLAIGDQNCSEPGILKLYDPDEEILPKEGTIAIFSAGRNHSAVYGGKTDRVMIGVNFYSLL
tara:strand:+ start:2351 stop:3940 length:1590 start_codon:yes stop_codon:yes gene_type:complete